MNGCDVLRELQRRLEELHGTAGTPDVCAFVVGDSTRRILPGAREGLPEQLFVLQDPAEPDGIDLALYIAPTILLALAHDDPHRCLHAGNLDGYWIALEGVSHFVLVVARAISGRPVSALELEIQAEVDKFVAAWRLLREQGMASDLAARQLARKLFASYVLREPMSAEEADRYHVSTRVARRFCSALTRRFGGNGVPARAEEDTVRRFVRLALSEKLRAA